MTRPLGKTSRRERDYWEARRDSSILEIEFLERCMRRARRRLKSFEDALSHMDKVQRKCDQQYWHGPRAKTVLCGEHSPELGYNWFCPNHYRQTIPK